MLKRAIVFGFLVLSAWFLSFSGCSYKITELEPSVNHSQPKPEITPSPVPMTIGKENFAREWKATFEQMKGEVSDNREKWKRNNITTYSFVAAKYIGGVSSPWNRNPVLIKVDNNQPVSFEVVDKSDVSSLARTDGFEQFDTIDKLFDYMLNELESGRMVKAKYDKKLGFPIWVSFLFSFEIHGGRSIEVSKFIRAD